MKKTRSRKSRDTVPLRCIYLIAWLVVHWLAVKQARVLFYSRQGIPLICFLLNTLHVHIAGCGKGYTPHVQTAGGGKKIHPARPQMAADGDILDIECWKSICNAGMPEKICLASIFLPIFSRGSTPRTNRSGSSPASAFRHRGSVRYRWSRISPALPSYVFYTLAM